MNEPKTPTPVSSMRLLCRRAWNWMQLPLAITALIIGIGALVWLLDFLPWRVNHPDAPWWGWLLHN